ncbi:hypothetical protein FRAHR75_350081 [Frankia sp. Hr75.2]|nr:hypothetical protein FRAHR75_350081 [Frankia sp. Hr75.2]
MSTTFVELTVPPAADLGGDDLVDFEGLELETAEAQTGCGDSNPYR